MADKPPPPLSSFEPPPTINLPPRSSAENSFIGAPGPSPGPMSLASLFFAENDRSLSFSELLSGAVPPSDSNSGGEGNMSMEFRVQQGNSANLVATDQRGTVAIPPGMSPLDSPDFFSSLQLDMGQLYGLAREQLQSQAHMQLQYPSSTWLPPVGLGLEQRVPPTFPNPNVSLTRESSDTSHSDQKFHSIAVDKPSDDGYNWRKYGQKLVKGSEFPRSYYKCTHPTCPVKKKVERDLNGQITEIRYRNEHNHPKPVKRPRDTVNAGNSELGYEEGQGYLPEGVSGSSDSGGVGNAETRGNERDEDEPDSKQRAIEVQNPEQASNRQTVTEPKIIVQTTSEVDLLDDGYRWRKYGQKVVKGNYNPRSYYKCTIPGCKVRKHVERAASDPKAVITTYEGRHNHALPAARNSTSSNTASQLRPQNTVVRPIATRGTESGSNQQSMALLQLKIEERRT